MDDEYAIRPHCEEDNPVDEDHKRTSSQQPPPPTISGIHADRFEAKVAEIIATLEKSADVPRLAALATSPGGLVTDELRRLIWPLLLGKDATSCAQVPHSRDWRHLPSHKDEDQVQLDVHRSFVFYPGNESETQLDRRKEELSDVILEILRRHPNLCYFQGFHDIVQVFLLVLGKDRAVSASAHLSLLRIRDFMLPSLSPSLSHLQLLPAILYSVDAKLCQHLSGTQPFFALAATLTLYAHEIEDYGDIARLFDFLLAQEAVVSMYLFAVIVLSRREELFEIPADEPEMLHFTLSKLPRPLNLEKLLRETMMLFRDIPPEQLPFRSWKKISAYSVLKTTRGSLGSGTLREGEKLFAKQSSELRKGELRLRAKNIIQKYKRPAGSIGIALLVGLVSFWLRRGGMNNMSDIIPRGIQKVCDFIKILGV